MTFNQMAKRVNSAFPECSIGCIKRVVVTDADNIRHFRLAWEILIAEPKEEKRNE